MCIRDRHSGWCAASATAPKTFDKYGKSTACGPDGEGGPWANQVYVIKGKLKYLPCDKEDLNIVCYFQNDLVHCRQNVVNDNET